MSLNTKWVPMKWPCGPLGIAQLSKSNSGDTELKATIEAWIEPSALQLLSGTPVSCLVVDWASGGAEDAAQQLALKPLIDAGRKRGISFVGKIAAKDHIAAIVSAGRAAGLEAVILEGPGSPNLDLPVIAQFANDGVEWAAATQIFSTTGNAWPGVNLPTMDQNTALAGPTGNPWVDSNGWFSRLAREMTSGKTLWLDIDPPDAAKTMSADTYCLAVADCQAYGSRWIVSLDAKTRTGITKKDQTAMDAWKRICETLTFFAGHPEWESYQAMGVLAVVSDFKGQNAFMSGEVLNLLNRRQVQFLIMERERMSLPSSRGLKGILWLDDDAPTAEQRKQLLAFVEQGGMLIAPKYWGPPGVTATKEDWLFDYDIYPLQKGRIVVASKGFPDQYQLANDAHLMVSRRNDFARLYNPATTNCYTCIDPAHTKQVVQVLNYSHIAASYVTLWVSAKARSAKLWGPKAQTSLSVESTAESDGTSFDLPPLSVNCAVEIERLA